MTETDNTVNPEDNNGYNVKKKTAEDMELRRKYNITEEEGVLLELLKDIYMKQLLQDSE